MNNPRYIHKLEEYPMPGSYLLENKILGAIVEDSSYLADAKAKLSDLSFDDTRNRELWNLLLKMDEQGDTISFQTVYPKCGDNHFKDYILPNIGTTTPLGVHDAINGLYLITVKRRAYIASMTILQSLNREDGADIAIRTSTDFLKNIEDDFRPDSTVSMDEALNTFAELISEREKARNEGKVVRIPTSFPTLDRITYNGWTAGQLVILAARPSIGKTAVMLQFARAAALNKSAAVVFSLEMTNNELVQRMLCATQEVNGYDLANGIVDWSKFETAAGKYAGVPLWFNDQCFTLDELSTQIRQLHKRGKCDIAFIDYLGLISYPHDNRTIYAQVTETTKRLKRLSKDAGIPIVLLCQLNRDMSKDGRAPELFDLRDSGSIEQDADIVLMLDRDLDPEKDYHNLMMYVRKNRQGELATISLKADSCITNFIEQ